jgi:hypothetical protein
MRGTGIWQNVPYQFQTYFAHVQVVVEDNDQILTLDDYNRMREGIKADKRFVGDPPILFVDKFKEKP